MLVCWYQAAARAVEGCGRGVGVEEMLHNTGGQLGSQQSAAGGILPESGKISPIKLSSGTHNPHQNVPVDSPLSGPSPVGTPVQ